jgi:hypothetical protein
MTKLNLTAGNDCSQQIFSRDEAINPHGIPTVMFLMLTLRSRGVNLLVQGRHHAPWTLLVRSLLPAKDFRITAIGWLLAPLLNARHTLQDNLHLLVRSAGRDCPGAKNPKQPLPMSQCQTRAPPTFTIRLQYSSCSRHKM